MKKLIALAIGIAVAAPSAAFGIQEFKRTGKIETNESGGYSESQRDPHAKRSKQIKEKTGAGYYQGGYHSASPEYRPGEWQFVEPEGGKSKPTYKKVKETDKKKTNVKKETKATKPATEKK